MGEITNVNQFVEVRLTDLGRTVHENYHNDAFRKVLDRFPYEGVEEDEDGWSRWQLWELMAIFGPHFGLGQAVPFVEMRIPAGQI